ncbi:putative AmphiWnt4 [Ixodes scapularis]|uniref:Protein Wnt n=1 Tax=Ixodes scapularis TaxID=6945 RepID=B7PG71_IXOSC|nr:AmphiWnt4, putative [Ixodes scapularis]|eukprot:XP_002434188.1 AmphiWnt4, putative [Ixodes scapularis]
MGRCMWRALAAFFAFLLVRQARGIEWLALSSCRLSWNVSLDCQHARQLHGLHARQVRLCRARLGAMPHVVEASQLAVDACQETFRDRRWNCSSVLRAPDLMADLTAGTREQAFVYALSSASLTQTWARACGQGRLTGCGCGRAPREPPQGDFKWGGCADNVRFGARLARAFTDAPWKRAPPDTAFRALLNRHNYKAGRQAVHESLTTLCKCHGVSGACNIKTCWRGLSSLRHVSQRLRRRYQVAVEVARHAPAGVGGSPHKIVPVSDHVGRLQKADLVYRTKSPDYCSWDTRVGSLGTEGRTCNSTESGTLGCDSMCCGRGYITLRKQVSERCHCRYHWCCFVECKTCSDWTLVDVCK